MVSRVEVSKMVAAIRGSVPLLHVLHAVSPRCIIRQPDAAAIQHPSAVASDQTEQLVNSRLEVALLYVVEIH